MIRRITSVDDIADTLADPAVRELSLVPADVAEIATTFSAPENVIFKDDSGACAIFEYEGSGCYDAHLLCSGRGADRLSALKEMVRELFTSHGARGIYCYIPRQNRAARVVARWLGGSFCGPYTDAAGLQLVLYTLTREQHVSRT